MPDELDSAAGRDPDLGPPVPYMDRTRRFYGAIGYAPYRWACHADVPFQPPRRPLSQSRIVLVTTAAPFQPDRGDQGPGAPYNAAAKFYDVYSGDATAEHDLRISHVAYDRQHTTAADPNTWFPLAALRRLAADGTIGGLAPRFHGAPTNRSHRHTVAVDCPELLARCREDGADAVLLVPNCPVCHQTCSLAARHLEQNGIPSVVMGCARDIVEHCGVPRFLWSDFPLGNSAGRPHDRDGQERTLRQALGLLDRASGPRTTEPSPQRWSDDAAWKLDYCNVDRIAADELERRRTEFEREKAVARRLRERVV